jgi:hypothetical protein
VALVCRRRIVSRALFCRCRSGALLCGCPVSRRQAAASRHDKEARNENENHAKTLAEPSWNEAIRWLGG